MSQVPLCPQCGQDLFWVPLSAQNGGFGPGWFCPDCGPIGEGAKPRPEGRRPSLLPGFFGQLRGWLRRLLRERFSWAAFARTLDELERQLNRIICGFIAAVGLVFVSAGLFGLGWPELNQLVWNLAGWQLRLAPPYDPFLTGLGLVLVARLLLGPGRL